MSDPSSRTPLPRDPARMRLGPERDQPSSQPPDGKAPATADNGALSSPKQQAVDCELAGINIEVLQSCPNGHPLVPDCTHLYPLGLFRCEICGHDKKPQPLPLRCDGCGYDICKDCYSGNIEKVSKLGKCEKGHPLVFSIFCSEDFGVPTQPYEYKCAKCDYKGYAKDGRWYCRLCCYNLCTKCENK